MGQEPLLFDNRTLISRTYIYLRDKIVNNELKPGSRINFEKLEKKLGVSRTPLRDAINRLEQDGLVEIKPRSGTFVSKPKKKDLEELYDVRKALEGAAVQLAIPHIPRILLEKIAEEVEYAQSEIYNENLTPYFKVDKKLHRTIIEYSHNQRLIKIMENLDLQIRWFSIMMTKNYDRPLRSNKMHGKILKAMINHKIDEAKYLMDEHIEDAKRNIVGDFS